MLEYLSVVYLPLLPDLLFLVLCLLAIAVFASMEVPCE